MKQPLRNPYSILSNLLADPLHILFLRLLAKAFGTFQHQAFMNVLERNAYAYGVIRGIGFARQLGLGAVSYVEFGVASGHGLDLLCRYRRMAGFPAMVYGLDTGNGMPMSSAWEDHPEEWDPMDFPSNCDLSSKFDGRATVLIGEIAKQDIFPATPVVFASLDVDYYSSSLDALEYLSRCSAQFCSVYCDDVSFSTASAERGQLLAVSEFNNRHRGRCCVTPDRTVGRGWLVGSAAWYDHMYIMHRKP